MTMLYSLMSNDNIDLDDIFTLFSDGMSLNAYR